MRGNLTPPPQTPPRMSVGAHLCLCTQTACACMHVRACARMGPFCGSDWSGSAAQLLGIKALCQAGRRVNGYSGTRGRREPGYPPAPMDSGTLVTRGSRVHREYPCRTGIYMLLVSHCLPPTPEPPPHNSYHSGERCGRACGRAAELRAGEQGPVSLALFRLCDIIARLPKGGGRSMCTQ